MSEPESKRVRSRGPSKSSSNECSPMSSAMREWRDIPLAGTTVPSSAVEGGEISTRRSTMRLTVSTDSPAKRVEVMAICERMPRPIPAERGWAMRSLAAVASVSFNPNLVVLNQVLVASLREA